MKVWITKYALTQGIFEAETLEETDDNGMIVIKRPDHYTEYFHGDDWHMTEKSAKIKAEQMRIKKIDSLKKQIAKFEKMKFE